VEKSLQLVRLLTDTHTSFYHEFAQSKRLEGFMKSLRQSALACLLESGDGKKKKRTDIPWGSSQV
jgi:hypothetical protein